MDHLCLKVGKFLYVLFLVAQKLEYDAAAPFQIAEEMEAKIVPQDSVGNIEFNDNTEPELNVYLWEGENRAKELSLKQNQLILPSQVGRYLIGIFAR